MLRNNKQLIVAWYTFGNIYGLKKKFYVHIAIACMDLLIQYIYQNDKFKENQWKTHDIQTRLAVLLLVLSQRPRSGHDLGLRYMFAKSWVESAGMNFVFYFDSDVFEQRCLHA